MNRSQANQRHPFASYPIVAWVALVGLIPCAVAFGQSLSVPVDAESNTRTVPAVLRWDPNELPVPSMQETFVSFPKVSNARSDENEENKEAELTKGRVFQRAYDFKEAEKEMKYSLYVPKNYDKANAAPLIIALHGLYGSPRQILSYPGFTRRAEKYGYIIAAPMGYNSRGWYGSRGKRGGWRNDPKNLGELSEKDVMNVLEIVLKDFNIDRQRIYLYGHSMGGGGAIHFAMKYPDIWAAIAPVAPAFWSYTRRLESAKAIPAIVIQGDKDSLVPVSGTRWWIERMKALEMEHRYIEVEGGGHFTVAFEYFDEIFDFFAEHPKPKSKVDEKTEPSAKPDQGTDQPDSDQN